MIVGLRSLGRNREISDVRHRNLSAASRRHRLWRLAWRSRRAANRSRHAALESAVALALRSGATVSRRYAARDYARARCQELLAGAATSRCPRAEARSHPPDRGLRRLPRPAMHFDSVVAARVLHRRLARMRVAPQTAGARVFGRSYAESAFTRHADQLVGTRSTPYCPVPMHWVRRLVRRANSAGAFGGRIGGPTRRAAVAPRLTARCATRGKQGPMLRTERLQNVRGAFRLTEDSLCAEKPCLSSTMCSPPAPLATKSPRC